GVVGRAALEDAARETPDAPASRIAVPPEEHQLIRPSAPAAELVERLSQLPDRLLLVVEGGALLGTVDPRALVAVLHRAEAERGAVLEP
ncbi:MAG TPA: hypothetical protein VJ788_08325, partial [Gemmatimonadota bacterium]|nr:hypothetical protein [Gemmatimonadota bacterium]